MILTALEAWQDFWNRFVSFFWVEDTDGINYLTRIIIAIAIILLGWLLIKFFGFLLKKAMRIKKKGPEIDVSAKTFIVEVIKIFMWAGIAYLVVAVLKIDTTGVAGVISAVTVALGLALQDVIGCFAAGVVILQQKHFSTGELIKVTNSFGSCEGFVTKIHFFFTYLKTVDGQEVTIPNINVLKAVVTNYTRLGTRRLNYDVNVSYDTDIELAKKVFMEILENDETVIKDGTATVYVVNLDAYAVQIRIRCWLKVDDFWPFYNSLSEKVLIACQKNKIYIPCSTDINISNRNI